MQLIDMIKEIPSRVEKSVHSIDAVSIEVERFLARFRFFPNEIVFIAGGSSYNAAFSVKYFVEKHLGIKVRLCYPNDFMYQRTVLNEKALYVLISPRGETPAVLESLQYLKSKGLMHLSLTADGNSVIARTADFHLDIGCEDEIYPFITKSFTCVAITILLLCISIAKVTGLKHMQELITYWEDMKKLPLSLQNMIDAAEDWVIEHVFIIKNKKSIIVSGEGELWPISKEAALKFMEMMPMMSSSYEIEELIHGPQNAFYRDMLFIFLYNRDFNSQKPFKVHKFIKNEVGDSILMTNEKVYDDDLYLEVKSKYFYFLEYVTVCQVLAYYFSVFNGRDLTRRLNTRIDDYIQSQF